MLVLSRRRDESIMIGDDIEVIIVDIRGDKVRLGITAPKDIPVHRKEIYEAIKREKAKKEEEKQEKLEEKKEQKGPANKSEKPSDEPLSEEEKQQGQHEASSQQSEQQPEQQSHKR